MTELRATRALYGIPPELANFFAIPGPQTVILRGGPGTGKTTLASTALAQFEGMRALVTTRVPKPVLLRQFPWLDGDGGPEGIEVVELVRFRGLAEGVTKTVEEMRRVLQARASDLVDLASVLNLPAPLSRALAAQTDRPRMIVIDSWDAWVENVLGQSSVEPDAPATRWELERSLLDVLLQTGAKVVLIVEREERQHLDYIADGGVHLTGSETDGRLERWMFLTKLRGVRLTSPSYPFSLEGGRFVCMVAAGPPAPPARAAVEPDPEQAPTTIWPGSRAFADAFGRLVPDEGVLLEVDGETPATVAWQLVGPMVGSALRSGARVIVRPPEGLSAGLLATSIAAMAPSVDLNERLRVAMPLASSPGGPRGPSYLYPAPAPLEPLDRSGPPVPAQLGGGSWDDQLARLEPADFLGTLENGRTPSLLVTFVDPVLDRPLSGRPLDPFLLVPLIARRAGASFANVAVAKSGDPSLDALRMHASVHLALFSRRGQYFVHGIRPWSPRFALTVPPGDGPDAAPYGLLPIV